MRERSTKDGTSASFNRSFKPAEVAKPETIDSSTHSLNLRVTNGKTSDGPIRLPLIINPEFIRPGDVRLEAHLSGLPVGLETRNIEKNLWEIEIPPNVVQLLSKDSKKVSYSGDLILNASGKSIPLFLILEPTKTTARASKTVHSAG
jgi:hypothetical protein